MREIKFRAWHKYIFKDWRTKQIKERGWKMTYFTLGSNDYWYTGDSGFYTIYEDEEYNQTRNIKKGTIFMQFTGLKDKNDAEIYEGDILQDENYKGEKQFHIVEFKDGGFITEGIPPWLGENSGDCYEVVGNIYENPELLEVKNV